MQLHLEFSFSLGLLYIKLETDIKTV